MNYTTKNELIKHYSRAIKGGDAALFVGAGMSRSSGYVDWKSLLKEIADDLKLDIDKESDLVTLAQYHVNTKNSRQRLNETLIHQFTKDSIVNENHKILSKLPIKSIWTTNYDTLIEDTLKDAGKVVDIKLTHQNLAINKPERDVILYKMHGDVSQPHDAVLTKDDYENYLPKRELFIENLKGDLISKTFLFLGFSFTDPNIDYVLSRVRVLLGNNQRPHYCIMRKPSRPKDRKRKELAAYKYDLRKLELKTEDLKRFAVETVLIDDYSEITKILKGLSHQAHLRNIFVSASAREYGSFGKERMYSLGNYSAKRSKKHLTRFFGKNLLYTVI